MTDQRQSSDQAKARDDARAKRLGDELRANLQKRKKQKRERSLAENHNSKNSDS